MYFGVTMIKKFLLSLLTIFCCILIGYEQARITLPSNFVLVVKGQIDKEMESEFELLSLEPAPHYKQTFSEKFHGWSVLGKIKISGEKEQQQILDVLNKGIIQAKKANRGVANCFEPRHGIHLIKKGQSIDYVICFSCWRVEKFVGNKDSKTIPINDSPMLTFNDLLIKSGVPLAKEQ
jgi:hypothetical protein